MKAKDVVPGDLLGRQGKGGVGEPVGIAPRLRQGIQIWTTEQKPLVISPVDMCAECDQVFDYADLQVDHIIPVSVDLTLALNPDNLQPLCQACHRKKTNTEQPSGDRRRTQVLMVKWEKVASCAPDGEEMTYDIEMPAPWHNFIANDFVVHNSYNEESGRYTQLKPEYYLAGRERPLQQVGKPGHYKFTRGTDLQFAIYCNEVMNRSHDGYESYQVMLDAGIAKEVARDVLPVNLYSSMWVSCNARSIMSYLSLRTTKTGYVDMFGLEYDNVPEPLFPSGPMWEIEQIALKMEQAFAQAMPLTHAAFRQHGTVAP